MDAQNYEFEQEHTSATPHVEGASVDGVTSKPKFECQHCGKYYLTKKSLKRHLDSTVAMCAKERFVENEIAERPSKPRWACSRCGKDCASSSSVDRHISRSCWKTCDECAFDGVIRCDSVTKDGPCRTCEAKERPCTKHTCPISGTKPLLFTGPKAAAQEKTLTDDEDASTTDKKPDKRKFTASSDGDLAGAHRFKRNVRTDEPVIDCGLGRVVDPLGGQAYVPPQVKEAAVTNWLQEQSTKSASAAQKQEEYISANAAQASLPQSHLSQQQAHQLFDLTQDFARVLPTAASYLPPRLNNGMSAPYYRHQAPLTELSKNFPTGHYGMMAQPRPLTLPQPQPHPYAGGPPTQFDTKFIEMQAIRQQQQAIQQQQARQQEQFRQQRHAHQQQQGCQLGPLNDTMLPLPLSCVASPHISGVNKTHAQGAPGMASLPRVTHNGPGQGDTVLGLRIHSNTYDKNGQPIFSILSIRRNEIFGPHLNAYCINRGKEYGLDWMFVYRYPVGTHDKPSQHMQITLTWDMTPANVKDDDFPGVAMRHMDTIYVMQAKPLSHSGVKADWNEAEAAQSPGLQVSRAEVDILGGETPFYQNPDVSAQWYRTVEQDAAHLRATTGAMKTTIARQQERIQEQDEEIAKQGHMLGELTDLSAQLRRRMQIPASDPLIQKLEKGYKDAENHVVRQDSPAPPVQRPTQQVPQQMTQQTTHQLLSQPNTHQAIPPQPRTKKNPTPFVTKCEAVRNPQAAPPLRSPLQFPSFDFAHEPRAPDYMHRSDVGAMIDPQLEGHGRFIDAADKIGTAGEGEGEGGGEGERDEMEE